MTDETKTTKTPKVELNYIANTEASAKIPNEQRLVTNVGQGKTGNDRFEVYFLIPKTEDECQARYGVDLAHLIELGVRNISTKPRFETAFDEKTGVMDHTALQKLADEYKPGLRQVASGEKKAAMAAGKKVLDALPEGMSIDDLIALAQKRVKK